MSANIVIDSYNKGFQLGALMALAIYGEAMNDYKVRDIIPMIQEVQMDPIMSTGYDAGLTTYTEDKVLPIGIFNESNSRIQFARR